MSYLHRPIPQFFRIMYVISNCTWHVRAVTLSFTPMTEAGVERIVRFDPKLWTQAPVSTVVRGMIGGEAVVAFWYDDLTKGNSSIVKSGVHPYKTSHQSTMAAAPVGGVKQARSRHLVRHTVITGVVVIAPGSQQRFGAAVSFVWIQMANFTYCA